MRKAKDLLLTLFEVTAYGSALLLLPCAIAGLFGCTLSSILIPVIFCAAIGTGILTGVAVHEGWYFDHLAGEDASVSGEDASGRVTPARRASSGMVEKVLRHRREAHRQSPVHEEQESKAA